MDYASDGDLYQKIVKHKKEKTFFTDDQIYQLAKDRTLTAKSMTLSYSRPLTKKLQAAGVD